MKQKILFWLGYIVGRIYPVRSVWVILANKMIRDIESMNQSLGLRVSTATQQPAVVECMYGPPGGLKSSLAKRRAEESSLILVDGNYVRNYLEYKRLGQQNVMFVMPMMIGMLVKKYRGAVSDIDHQNPLKRGGFEGLVTRFAGRKVRFSGHAAKSSRDLVLRSLLLPFTSHEIDIPIPPWYQTATHHRPELFGEARRNIIHYAQLPGFESLRVMRDTLNNRTATRNKAAAILRVSEFLGQQGRFYNSDGTQKVYPGVTYHQI